jgi:rhodanese-related sulfurtransferase
LARAQGSRRPGVIFSGVGRGARCGEERAPTLLFRRTLTYDLLVAGISVDELLAAARAQIERLEPAEAAAAAEAGALIVDLRPQEARERDGIVPGSLHVPRSVLEWRLDLDSPYANPHVGGRERRLILLCDHGFSSSLAAAAIVELGYARVGDVVGGFEAWLAAGLPVSSPSYRPAPGEPAGMGPPER